MKKIKIIIHLILDVLFKKIFLINPQKYLNESINLIEKAENNYYTYNKRPKYIENYKYKTTYNSKLYKKSAIKIVSDIDSLTDLLNDTKINITIYEDNASDDCAICMTNEKCMIIVPCGHYYTCATCTALIKKCPICRCGFTKAINKSQML